jgi:hypothetical protein
MTPTDPSPPDSLEFGEPTRPGHFRRRNLVAGLAAVAVFLVGRVRVRLSGELKRLHVETRSPETVATH